MNRFNTMTIGLAFLLIATNIAWGIEYSAEKSALASAQHDLATIVQNKKILAFQKLFIDKVLNADGVVDFNTRVQLQNAVTDIHDDSIAQAWTGFLAAKTEAEGQLRVKELLSLLATKAYAQ